MSTNTNTKKNKADLIKVGFNADLLDELLETMQAAEKVEVLANVGLGLVNNHGFDKKDLVKLVFPRGGASRLERLDVYWPLLKEYGFTTKDVIKIASHDGGHLNLQALAETWPTLKEYGLEAHGLKESNCNNKAVLVDILKDILNVASHRQGNQNLKALVETWPTLKEYHLTWKNAIKVVSHPQGNLNLNTLVETWPILKKYGLEAHGLKESDLEESDCNNKAVLADILKDILNVASHRQGNRSLVALVKTWPRLKEHHFTWKNIVKTASAKKGYSKLCAALEKAALEKAALEKEVPFCNFINSVVSGGESFFSCGRCSQTDTSTSELPNCVSDNFINGPVRIEKLPADVACPQTSALKQSANFNGLGYNHGISLGGLQNSAKSEFFINSKRKNSLVDSDNPSEGLVTKKIRR